MHLQHKTSGNEQYSALEKHLLNDFQQNFPLDAQPFARIAQQFGYDEQTVIDTYRALKNNGVVSRIGPVFRANRVGASTLAAMAVAAENLEKVAAQISHYNEVNHNYQREHHFNLWFVVTARDQNHLQQVLKDMESETELPIMSLPMLDDFFIDLGFELKWT